MSRRQRTKRKTSVPPRTQSKRGGRGGNTDTAIITSDEARKTSFPTKLYDTLQLGKIMYLAKMGPRVTGKLLVKMGIKPDDEILPGITHTILSYAGGLYLTRMLYVLLQSTMAMSYNVMELSAIKREFYASIINAANPSQFLTLVSCTTADTETLLEAAKESGEIVGKYLSAGKKDIATLLHGTASRRSKGTIGTIGMSLGRLATRGMHEENTEALRRLTDGYKEEILRITSGKEEIAKPEVIEEIDNRGFLEKLFIPNAPIDDLKKSLQNTCSEEIKEASERIGAVIARKSVDTALQFEQVLDGMDRHGDRVISVIPVVGVGRDYLRGNPPNIYDTLLVWYIMFVMVILFIKKLAGRTRRRNRFKMKKSRKKSRKRRSAKRKASRKRRSAKRKASRKASRKRKSVKRKASRKRRSAKRKASRKRKSVKRKASRKRRSAKRKASRKRKSVKRKASRKRKSVKRKTSRKRRSAKRKASRKRKSAKRKASRKRKSAKRKASRKRKKCPPGCVKRRSAKRKNKFRMDPITGPKSYHTRRDFEKEIKEEAKRLEDSPEVQKIMVKLMNDPGMLEQSQRYGAYQGMNITQIREEEALKLAKRKLLAKRKRAEKRKRKAVGDDRKSSKKRR